MITASCTTTSTRRPFNAHRHPKASYTSTDPPAAVITDLGSTTEADLRSILSQANLEVSSLRFVNSALGMPVLCTFEKEHQLEKLVKTLNFLEHGTEIIRATKMAQIPDEDNLKRRFDVYVQGLPDGYREGDFFKRDCNLSEGLKTARMSTLHPGNAFLQYRDRKSFERILGMGERVILTGCRPRIARPKIEVLPEPKPAWNNPPKTENAWNKAPLKKESDNQITLSKYLTPKQLQENNLRVTNFGDSYTHEIDLGADFGKFGKIVRAKLNLAKKVAFIAYDNEQSAAKAIKVMHTHVLPNGRHLCVQWNSEIQSNAEGKNIIIKNWPSAKTEEDLHKIFRGCGMILGANVKNFLPGLSCIAYVNFRTPEEAATAKEKWNGQAVDGRILEVNIAQPGLGKRAVRPLGDSTNQVRTR
ncbi:hypothetical protein L596_024642 [Steinernema carpocapsae]|uniref:RRM domain-containing protein n=1 Tax=Steinernema carpocapsae TaxID=34508 RepID=A0A4U5M5C3_STECR|nr:hypothetical protein L596_024642 [Steinernema carpocapsae]